MDTMALRAMQAARAHNAMNAGPPDGYSLALALVPSAYPYRRA